LDIRRQENRSFDGCDLKDVDREGRVMTADGRSESVEQALLMDDDAAGNDDVVTHGPASRQAFSLNGSRIRAR
jgi:hypothetical protein